MKKERVCLLAKKMRYLLGVSEELHAEDFSDLDLNKDKNAEELKVLRSLLRIRNGVLQNSMKLSKFRKGLEEYVTILYSHDDITIVNDYYSKQKGKRCSTSINSFFTSVLAVVKELNVRITDMWINAEEFIKQELPRGYEDVFWDAISQMVLQPAVTQAMLKSVANDCVRYKTRFPYMIYLPSMKRIIKNLKCGSQDSNGMYLTSCSLTLLTDKNVLLAACATVAKDPSQFGLDSEEIDREEYTYAGRLTDLVHQVDEMSVQPAQVVKLNAVDSVKDETIKSEVKSEVQIKNSEVCTDSVSVQKTFADGKITVINGNMFDRQPRSKYAINLSELEINSNLLEQLKSFLNKDNKGAEVFVDCDNVSIDSVAFILSSIPVKERSKIKKVHLVLDDRTVIPWSRVWGKDYNFIIERVGRIKEAKSVVDIRLTARVCRSYYSEQIENFIIIASDSDYYGMITSMPNADFLVVHNDGRASQDFLDCLVSLNVPTFQIPKIPAELSKRSIEAVCYASTEYCVNAVGANNFDMQVCIETVRFNLGRALTPITIEDEEIESYIRQALALMQFVTYKDKFVVLLGGAEDEVVCL